MRREPAPVANLEDAERGLALPLHRARRKPKSGSGRLLPRVSNDEEIEVVPSVKTLGVWFSEDMSWNSHIKYIQNKRSRNIGISTRYKKLFPTRVKHSIYNSLIYSHLNYCHLVWGTTTKSNITKLHLLQKRTVRAIARVPYLHSTDTLFTSLKIRRINNIYNHRLLNAYCNATRHSITSFIILADLTQHSSVYELWQRQKWQIKKSHTKYFDQTLHFNLSTMLDSCFFSDNIDVHTLSTGNYEITTNI